MRLIDAHCHLAAKEFEGQLDALLGEARAAGVLKLVTAPTVPEQWAVSRDIAARFPEVAFAWGIHPWSVKEEHLSVMDQLRGARAAGACAIGEIGLDAKVASTPMDLQLRIFEAQLLVAKELELPVVLHCRGAFNELTETLKRVGAPARGGIIHAFSGSEEVAEACMRHGLSFSMGGALTYHRSNKRAKVLEKIYPGHLLLETDCPDIPPIQSIGNPNVPANLLHNLRGAAAYLGESEEAIAEQTTQNAMRLFGLTL